jgi:cytochrome P450
LRFKAYNKSDNNNIRVDKEHVIFMAEQTPEHTELQMPDAENLQANNDPLGIFTAEARRDPHPIYAKMRELGPLYSIRGELPNERYWFITHYEDCAAALKNPAIGKDFRKRLPAEMLAQRPPQDPMIEMTNRNMLFVDPPDHTRMRGLVHKAFTPRMIQNLRGRITQLTDELIEKMGEHGEVDLIDQFAYPLPITVIAELLGIPMSDQEQFRQWTHVLLFGADIETVQQSALSFVMYFHNMFDERRANPKEDLITALVQAEEEGDKLDGEELIGMIFLLLVAGHETTVNLIGNGILSLTQNREQFDKLRAEPNLVKNAVEEIIRYNGPVETATVRWAFDGAQVQGQTIPLGDIVFISLHSANRDPAIFRNPDRFDITRPDASKHLGFGSGIHYCLGAPLARMEGAIALNALLKHFPNLDVALPVNNLEWNLSILLHGMKALPVRY